MSWFERATGFPGWFLAACAAIVVFWMWMLGAL